MKYLNLKIINDFKSQDEKFPNRHKEIHKGCCKNCPSNFDKINGIIDPECEEIKELPKDVIAKEFLFVCAWRNNKLCKGICDFYEIDKTYLDNIYNG